MRLTSRTEGRGGVARVEAFSDGVLAIIITIMVLELKAPEEPGFAALAAPVADFFAYVLSYAYIAIYWVNHHRLFSHARIVTNGLLWSNIALLFALSLMPFSTAYSASTSPSRARRALYALSLLLPSLAYRWLEGVIAAPAPRTRKRAPITASPGARAVSPVSPMPGGAAQPLLAAFGGDVAGLVGAVLDPAVEPVRPSVRRQGDAKRPFTASAQSTCALPRRTAPAAPRRRNARLVELVPVDQVAQRPLRPFARGLGDLAREGADAGGQLDLIAALADRRRSSANRAAPPKPPSRSASRA